MPTHAAAAAAKQQGGAVVRLALAATAGAEPAPLEARPPRGDVSQAYLDTLSNWTIESVKAALDQHEQGDFSSSAMLADATLRDPQVYSALRTRVSALASRSGVPFTMDPAVGVDGRRAESVAERMLGLWWTSCPEAEVAALDRDAIMLGVAVGRVRWTLSADEWVPRICRYRPHGLRWDETTKTYRYRTQDGGDEEVTPGRGGWLLHAPNGGDSWMLGAIRAIGNTWVTRAMARRDRSRYSQKHGLPLLKVHEPFQAADDIEGTGGTAAASVPAFYQQFATLSPQRNVIRCPRGQDEASSWDVEFIAPQAGTSHAVFRETLDDTRRDVLAILLGRDPEMSGSVGGDGVSLLTRVEVEALAADAEGMATTLREQVWKPWVGFNIDRARLELAAWPKWQTRPGADLAARAGVLTAVGPAVVQLDAAGIDTTDVLEEFGLRLKAGEVVQPPAPPAPAAPTAPSSATDGAEE